MFRSICSLMASFGLLASVGNSQSASVHGPIAGFVYDRAQRTVQPLFGVPGATYAGPPVLDQLDSASVAPGGKWALISRSGVGAFVRGLPDLTFADSPAEGLIDTADRVVWTAGGSYALLYSSTRNQLQRVHFSESDVVADAPLDLSPWGPAPITSLAIDPAGRQMAFGIAGSGLYSLAPGQSPVLLSSMTRPAAVTFDETGNRLYAADLDQQRILEFDSGSSGVEFASFARTDGPPLNAAGLAVSAGARYLLLADSATRSVLVYETATHNLVNSISLDFPPSRMEAISDFTYLLNGDNSGEWLLVLDARQTPSVYFVPATTPATTKELQ